MSKRIDVTSHNTNIGSDNYFSYDIVISDGFRELGALLEPVLNGGVKAAVFSDDRVYRIYGKTLESILDDMGVSYHSFVFPSGEESKNLETVNLGQHVLAEFFECDPNILNNIDKVEKYMIDAALERGATIVQKCFHMFNPYGVSGVVIISESHLAIHTWPELGYAAVDLFTCGTKCDPKVAYEFLKQKFNSKKASFTELKRGIIDRETLKLSEQPFEVAEQFAE